MAKPIQGTFGPDTKHSLFGIPENHPHMQVYCEHHQLNLVVVVKNLHLAHSYHSQKANIFGGLLSYLVSQSKGSFAILVLAFLCHLLYLIYLILKGIDSSCCLPLDTTAMVVSRTVPTCLQHH